MKTNALMYRPSSQGTTWAGLFCAGSIFAVAICLGRTRIEPAMPYGSFDNMTTVDLVEPDPDPVLAPDEPRDEPPQPETLQDAFPEQQPVEHRKTVNKPKRPFAWPGRYASNPGAGSTSAPSSTALYAPHPDYPYEARRQNAIGSGVAILTIDQSGLVSALRMERSTGKSVLDASALRTFARWRFRPGAPQVVSVPIIFTLTGASY